MGGGSCESLYEISEAMGKDRDNVILVLDEIHNACKSTQGLAEQLKTFLDEGGDFPHVIGITTDFDFSAVMKDSKAFTNRFHTLEVGPMEANEIRQILAKIARSHSEKPLLAPGAFDTIVSESSKTALPQPKASIDLLNECIRIVSPGSKGTIPPERMYQDVKPTVDELLTSANLKDLTQSLQSVELNPQVYDTSASSINPLECLKQSYLSLEERMLQTMKKVAKIDVPIPQHYSAGALQRTYTEKETRCLSELWLIGSILRPTILETMLTLQGQITDCRPVVIDDTVINDAARNLAYTDSSY